MFLSETLVRLEGAPEIILEKLTGLGVFKTKTEAIRAAILDLGKDYKVFNSLQEIEQELVARKLQMEEKEMKRKGIKYLSKEKALVKYR